MWLCTKYGFFSVVCSTEPMTKELLMVRARDRTQLASLKKAFPDLLEGAIKTTTTTDYPYRIIIPRDKWLGLAMHLAGDVDYHNFKACVHGASPGGSYSSYTSFLHEVWRLGIQFLQKPVKKW